MLLLFVTLYPFYYDCHDMNVNLFQLTMSSLFFNIANSCSNISLVQFKSQTMAMAQKRIMMVKR